MTKILDTLRTPGAMLVALVLALVAQLEHTAQVFMQVIGANGVYAQVHAYAFACAVEVAVLLFVLAGHKRISYGFALATFATNLSYYAMHDVALLSIAGAPAWLMSALLPCAVVGYSHTIADTQPAPEYKPAKAAERPQKARTSEVRSTSTNITAGEELGANVPASEADSAQAEPPKLAKAERLARIKAERITDPAAIAAQFRVSLRTAQMDLADVREGMTQTNGKGHA